MKFSCIVVATLLASAALSAMAQEKPAASQSAMASAATPGAAPPMLQQRNERYRLRKGDSFDLDFALSPEFNQNVVVQPDGYVTLKSAGSFYVEGQTLPQLSDTIKDAYAKILHDPVISVSPKEFERPYFIAAGQVQRPGKYDLRSSLTVSQGVAIAGGFNDRAKHSQVVLYHPLPTGGYDAKLLDVKKLMAKRDLSEDLVLQPGDMVFVPQNKMSKIRPFLPSPTAGMGAFYSPAMN